MSTSTSKPNLTIIDGHAYCTSLELARHFGKSHDNVLKAIRRKISECSEAFGLVNFNETSTTDRWNRPQPIFHLTRDGFAIVAMGFTGREATKWQEAYIAAFNAMEAELRRKSISERTLRKIEQLELFATDIRQEVRADAAAAALNIAGVFMPPIPTATISKLIKKGALEGRFDAASRRWFVYRDSLNAMMERRRLKAA